MSRKRHKAKITNFAGRIPLPSQVSHLFEAGENARRQREADLAWRQLPPHEKLAEINRLKGLRYERYGR
jgi:hypothetical protein